MVSLRQPAPVLALESLTINRECQDLRRTEAHLEQIGSKMA